MSHPIDFSPYLLRIPVKPITSRSEATRGGSLCRAVIGLGQYGLLFSHGASVEFELAGVVDKAVEDGAGEGGVAEQLMPSSRGELAGDEGGARGVAVFDESELPRFGGHLNIVQRRCSDDRKAPPLRAGVPAPDGRVGAGGDARPSRTDRRRATRPDAAPKPCSARTTTPRPSCRRSSLRSASPSQPRRSSAPSLRRRSSTPARGGR